MSNEISVAERQREPLINNTQVREFVRQFYKKIPNEEIARAVTRMTGLPCVPRDIRYLALPAKRSKGLAVPFVSRGKRGQPPPVPKQDDIQAGIMTVAKANASLVNDTEYKKDVENAHL